jgi:hypothetical protein
MVLTWKHLVAAVFVFEMEVFVFEMEVKYVEPTKKAKKNNKK